MSNEKQNIAPAEIQPLNMGSVSGCLVLIDSLRNSDEYIRHIFMEGSCYKFFLFLKAIYPFAEPYIHQDKDHIVAKIYGKLFDIRGIIEDKFECLYSPLNEIDLKMCESWSFHKNNLLQLCECPACDEPICYDAIFSNSH